MLTVNGLVLMQRTLGEQDRFIDILTADHGVLEVLVKGAGKLNSKTGSATQLFTYSELCLNDKRNGVRILNSVTPLSVFYGLRSSVSAIALASYFSQVIRYAVLPRSGAPEILQLVLNCLYMLSERRAPETKIKAIFELRIASLLGFMPDVIMCRSCGKYLPEQLVFSVSGGYFCCEDCISSPEDETGLIHMPAGTLQAIRFIVLSEPKKIFSFAISERSCKPLYQFAEEFLCYQMERKFPALDHYHSLQQTMLPDT